MRSAIIFALFALAVCQSPLDIVTGFTNQLVFTDAQNTDVNNCMVGLFQELQGLAPIYNDYITQNFESIITDGASYLENFEAAVQTACLPVLIDLDNYAVTFGNGQEPKVNLESNGAYVAQQVALLVQYVSAKNFTGVGQTVGYIFQIAVGSVDLPSLKPEALTQEEAQSILQNYQIWITNQDGAFTQYIQAYVDELGLTNQVNATALATLFLGAENLTTIVESFRQSLNGDFDSDITTIENFVTEVLEFVRANQQGLQAVVAIDAPIYNAFVSNPIGYTAYVVYNILLNAPKLEGFTGQVQTDLIAGDFTAIGQQAGDIATAVYGPVF